jgi:hypothetical protein
MVILGLIVKSLKGEGRSYSLRFPVVLRSSYSESPRTLRTYVKRMSVNASVCFLVAVPPGAGRLEYEWYRQHAMRPPLCTVVTLARCRALLNITGCNLNAVV